MNLFSILEEGAKKWPDDVAVVHAGLNLRYSDLHEAAQSLAVKLRQVGIQAGDKVGVMCPSSTAYIIAFFAVLRAGGIVVPISPALKTAEIHWLATEMALDAFCYSTHFSSLMLEGDEKTFTEFPISGGRTSLCIKLALTRATLQSERDQLLKINAASIGFSSGTTSKAKGIILSHATIWDRAQVRSQMPPIAKASGLLWLRPMDPFPYQICGSFLEGAKVLLADSLVLERLPQLITEHRIDQIHANPLFYRMLIQEGLTKQELPNVRYFVSTGSSLPNLVAEVFRSRFGREIVQMYGLIECAPVLVNSSEDLRKRGSVGTPTPGREVKLTSSDSDASEDEGVGEILVRGPGLFDAYYKPWRLRDEVLEDGWLRTGDLARRDADGYYWIVGRTKEVINVGGVKVFPSEIEEVLLSHPSVAEAMVFGAAEPRFGEVAHGRVKLRSGAVCTERELLRHVNERLSVFKALRSVEFVDEIPKTVTGKTRRSV